MSLSDRFGLAGVPPCSQETYLAMIQRYVGRFGLSHEAEVLRAEALEWSKTRGSRSGRVAWRIHPGPGRALGRRPSGDRCSPSVPGLTAQRVLATLVAASSR